MASIRDSCFSAGGACLQGWRGQVKRARFELVEMAVTGKLEMIAGPMRCNKTAEFLRRIETRRRYAWQTWSRQRACDRVTHEHACRVPPLATQSKE